MVSRGFASACASEGRVWREALAAAVVGSLLFAALIASSACFAGNAYADESGERLHGDANDNGVVNIVDALGAFAIQGYSVKGNWLAAAQVGDIVSFGTYEQDGNAENGAEAIEWYVLDVVDGKALLLSRYGLDCQKYNDEMVDTTWETSSLRAWLNSDFVEAAFSSSDLTCIADTQLDNTSAASDESGRDGGNNTTDKLFCLSSTEQAKYLSIYQSDPGYAYRICTLTAYAASQGAYQDDNGACAWWLRSPGYNAQHAVYMANYGDRENSGAVVTQSNFAVRPALWVNL